MEGRRFINWVYAERVRYLSAEARVRVDAELNAPPVDVIRQAINRPPDAKGQRKVPAFFAKQTESAATWAAMARSKAVTGASG